MVDRPLKHGRPWLLLLVFGALAAAPSVVASGGDAVAAPEYQVDDLVDAVDDVTQAAAGPHASFVCSAAAQGLLVRIRDTSSDQGSLRHWDLGDGTQWVAEPGQVRSHFYDGPGVYRIRLTLVEENGGASIHERSCAALPAPPRPSPALMPGSETKVVGDATENATGTAAEAPQAGSKPVLIDGVQVDPSLADDLESAAAVLERAQALRETATDDVQDVVDTIDEALLGLHLLDLCLEACQDQAEVGPPAPHALPVPGAGAPTEEQADPMLLAAPGGSGPGAMPAAEAPFGPRQQPAPRPVTEASVATPGGNEEMAQILVVTAAAGAVALAAPGLLRRLGRLLTGPLAGIGLFTRLKEDRLLDHPVRSQVMQAIEAEPGIHYQALVRAVEKGNGVLEHHLRMLRSAGLVKERAASGYTCYFPARTDRRVMDAHAVLKSDVARRVLDICLQRPGNAVGEVAKAVGVTPKAVSYHLDRFERVGLVRTEKMGRSVLVYANPVAMHTVPAVAADAA